MRLDNHQFKVRGPAAGPIDPAPAATTPTLSGTVTTVTPGRPAAAAAANQLDFLLSVKRIETGPDGDRSLADL